MTDEQRDEYLSRRRANYQIRANRNAASRLRQSTSIQAEETTAPILPNRVRRRLARSLPILINEPATSTTPILTERGRRGRPPRSFPIPDTDNSTTTTQPAVTNNTCTTRGNRSFSFENIFMPN